LVTAALQPGILEPIDEVDELLRMCDVDVHVAAVDERDDESVQHTPAPGVRIPHQAEPTEVDLSELARLARGSAYREPAPIREAAVFDREAVQRAVGNLHALASEQLMHLRQAQPALPVAAVEPGLDALLMRQQLFFRRTQLDILGNRSQVLLDGSGELLTRLLLSLRPTEPARHPHVAPNRLTAAARRLLDLRDALATPCPPQDLQDFPHVCLSVTHRAHLLARTMARGPGVGNPREKTRRKLGKGRENTRPSAGECS
jgi:hypothetical protein